MTASRARWKQRLKNHRQGLTATPPTAQGVETNTTVKSADRQTLREQKQQAEFQARKKADLLTPQEAEKGTRRLEKRRI